MSQRGQSLIIFWNNGFPSRKSLLCNQGLLGVENCHSFTAVTPAKHILSPQTRVVLLLDVGWGILAKAKSGLNAFKMLIQHFVMPISLWNCICRYLLLSQEEKLNISTRFSAEMSWKCRLSAFFLFEFPNSAFPGCIWLSHKWNLYREHCEQERCHCVSWSGPNLAPQRCSDTLTWGNWAKLMLQIIVLLLHIILLCSQSLKCLINQKARTKRIAFAIDLLFLWLALVGLQHTTNEHSLSVNNAGVQNLKHCESSFFHTLV